MPELPEVETIRRQLAPRLEQRTLIGGDAHPSAKFAPALDAVGATITAVRRRGKYLLFDLDGDEELVAHLGMTGSFLITPAKGTDPECGQHDSWVRAVWRMDDGNDLVFRDIRRFGRLRVVEAGRYDDIPTLRDMGPEPFDPAFTGRSLHAHLKKSRRSVKTQLLSQRPVAGVGNIYADEALFIARIHPQSRRVGPQRCELLAQAITDVLRTGVENGGTTLRDYVDADGDEGRNQHSLLAYGRGGEPCVECGTPLSSRTIDARTSTFCAVCQRH
jgi:formamidopyrimidine-DNA glycosylase